MKVAVKTVNVSFPLECLAGETTTTYNQVGVSGVEKPGHGERDRSVRGALVR
ncbi:hypothetical protein ACG2OD_01625 [Streptomyces sp. PDY-4]|uniref:hypothetical protein n=1 Tax=Streptomyces sp. PDY-4 TaxID=3376070 RepID=UPI0037A867B1